MVCRLQMVNNGSVKLEYSWQVLMDRYGKGVNFDHGGNFQTLPSGSEEKYKNMLSIYCMYCISADPVTDMICALYFQTLALAPVRAVD